jgi:hypothetical protein
MSIPTWVKVARYHLVDRLTFVGLPWAVLGFAFLVDFVIFAIVHSPHHAYAGGLATIFVFSLIYGHQSVVKSLPFGLALGLSRRSYYLGTAFLALAISAAYSLALTVLQAIERATGGWGESLHVFRVPFILNGPWYLTWLTSFVVMTLLFLYGMWSGLVYRRWSVAGVVAFIAGQVVVVLAAALAVTWTGTWANVGHFFTDLSANGLTGVLAALAVALLAGGSLTIRRIAV